MRIIKVLFGIIVLLSFIYRMFYQTIVVVYYEMNKTYISQELCKNRMRPGSTCHGKCYLKKMLKKTETPDEQKTNPLIPPNATSNKDFKVIVLDAISLHSSFQETEKKEIKYFNTYKFLYTFFIFVPPKNIV